MKENLFNRHIGKNLHIGEVLIFIAIAIVFFNTQKILSEIQCFLEKICPLPDSRLALIALLIFITGLCWFVSDLRSKHALKKFGYEEQPFNQFRILSTLHKLGLIIFLLFGIAVIIFISIYYENFG